MSFNRTNVSVRFMKALMEKVRKKADKEEMYISDILEAGVISVLDKERPELVQLVENFKKEFKKKGGK